MSLQPLPCDAQFNIYEINLMEMNRCFAQQKLPDVNAYTVYKCQYVSTMP